MAISGEFLLALQRSPGWGTNTLSFKSGSPASLYYDANVDGTYGPFEWSYQKTSATNYEIKGGSDLACQHGASALLEELGFRFYWPYVPSWKIPATINMDLVQPKQAFLMPDNVLALAYGMNFSNLVSEYNRWRTLIGMDQEFFLAGHRWGSIGLETSILNSGFWLSRPGILVDRAHQVDGEPNASFVPDGLPPTGNPPIMTITATNTSTYKRGANRLLVDFTVDGDDGNAYFVISTSSTKPLATQVEAGLNHLAAAVPNRTIPITASGTHLKRCIPENPVVGAPTSQTPRGEVNYYIHAVYKNAGGQYSSVVSTPLIQTNRNNFTFDIQVAKDNGWYNDFVELCAAYLLTAGLNEMNTTSYDAADTDPQESDIVFPYTKDVATKVRTGTNAIGPYPAMTGNPLAQLGLYAYAGHRVPPTDSVSPGVFTQVALGFNRTKFSYFELVKLHAEQADAIKLREYWGTPLWDRAQPMQNGRTWNNYFNRYTNSDPANGYIAAAASAGKQLLGVHAECSANHLANLVMWRWGIKTLRGINTTYAACLQEIVDDIFDGDPKVVELYEFFSYQLNRWHKYSLQTAMEIVDAMQPGWYKTLYQHWMVFCYEWLTLPNQLPTSDPNWNTVADPFPAAFSKMMSHAYALRDTHIIQTYGVMRTEANGAVASTYPALRYTPTPAWATGAYLPTEADFDAYLLDLQTNNDRNPNLDSDDVVVVRGLTSRDGSITSGTGFYHRGGALYGVVGPATVVLEYPDSFIPGDDGGDDILIDGGTEEIVVPDHTWKIIDVLEEAKVYPKNAGELIFLVCFPPCFKYTGGSTGNAFSYIQQAIAGNTKIKPGTILQVHDQNGTHLINPIGSAGYTGYPTNLGPGVIRYDYTNTKGLTIENANPYMSMHPGIHAMARAIAEADFGTKPGVVKITRG